MKKTGAIFIIWMVLMSTVQGNEDVWFTAEGQEDSKPLVFRARQNVPAGIETKQYPFLISIFWRYKPANEGGMPDAETNDGQIALEDALESLDSKEYSFLMLVVTGNGRKEWHWYVEDVEKWMNKLNESLKGHPVYPIEIENSQEPDWSLYKGFLSGVKRI
jgi:hypothetical protein